MMINRLSSQPVPKEIQNKLDLFFQELKEIGVSYIGHGVVSDEGNHSGYFSKKQWGEHYIQRQYFFAEPILKQYKDKKEIDLISWTTVKDVNSIAQMRNEFTQVTSGVTICKKDDVFNTFFNIGFSKDVDLARFTFLNKDLLLAYFHAFNENHLLWRKNKSF